MLANWLYMEPQKKKLNGVMTGAIDVVIAVKETDSTVFPFESDVKKLEILPPGHEATNIIPRAIIGVMKGFNITARINVMAGRANHCSRIPVRIDLGLLTISFIVSGLMPKATPNITKARMIFTIVIPSSPKLMVTELRDSSCSFIAFRLLIINYTNLERNFHFLRFLLIFSQEKTAISSKIDGIAVI